MASVLLLPVTLGVALPAHAPDRVIVQFEASRIRAAEATAILPPGAALKEMAHVALARGEKRAARVPIALEHPLLCSVPPGWTATGLVQWLSARPGVRYAEPDYIGTGGAVAPSDPDFVRQWHHRNTNTAGKTVPADIRTLEAWDITTGSSNVVVAVLDSGLVTNLAEFAGRTVPGYDFVNNDADPFDDHGHGTAVAGVIAQNAGNTNRGVGVDQQCRIMPLKVLNASNAGFYSDWASAVYFAVSNGARVLNLSAGGTSSDVTLSNAIMHAVASGAIFVTITHNDGIGTVRFPGRMTACITVGGTTSNDVRWSSSNWGPSTDLVAPAQHVRSVSTANGVYNGSGTSFAAPLVAGVAGLVLAVRPELRHEEVRRLLCLGADDQVGAPGEDVAGFDNYHGWGRLNARATLDLALANFHDIRIGGAGPVLHFIAPTNAAARLPLVVEQAAFPGAPWGTNGLGSVTYALTSGAVNAGAAPSGSVFRLRVRDL